MAEAAALQESLRTARGRVHHTPEERQLLRARAIEIAALANLAVDDRPEVRAQLADAWADQGRFDEAAKIHPNVDRQRRYTEIAQAIERDDDETCPCEDQTVMDVTQNKNVVVYAQNIDKMVYSRKHRKLMPLVRCACGDLNVRPAPVHLQRRLDNLKTA